MRCIASCIILLGLRFWYTEARLKFQYSAQLSDASLLCELPPNNEWELFISVFWRVSSYRKMFFAFVEASQSFPFKRIDLMHVPRRWKRLSEHETVSTREASRKWKIDKSPEAHSEQSIQEAHNATKSIPDKLLMKHLTRMCLGDEDGNRCWGAAKFPPINAKLFFWRAQLKLESSCCSPGGEERIIESQSWQILIMTLH